jgi:hypothetical protein
MQLPEDLITIIVKSTRKVVLDLERMNQDPVWQTIVDSNPQYNDPEILVQLYVAHYLWSDQFPHLMPSTNGPGDLDDVSIEVKRNGV